MSSKAAKKARILLVSMKYEIVDTRKLYFKASQEKPEGTEWRTYRERLRCLEEFQKQLEEVIK